MPSLTWTTVLSPLVAARSVPGASNGVTPHRPRAAVRAAVLALTCAVLLLGSVVVLLLDLLTAGPASAAGRWATALGALATCTLAGAGAVGALALLRGAGRGLLLTAAWVQAGVLAAALAGGVVDLAHGAVTLSTALAVALGCAVGLTLAGSTIAAGQRRDVDGWVGSARAWHRVTGDPHGQRACVLALALLTPVAVLAAATVVAAGTAARGTAGGGSAGVEPGPATEPPAAGDPGWSAEFTPYAEDCAAGRMTACDDLYWSSSVGGVYERYGSTCGGRLAREVAGGCSAVVGSTPD